MWHLRFSRYLPTQNLAYRFYVCLQGSEIDLYICKRMMNICKYLNIKWQHLLISMVSWAYPLWPISIFMNHYWVQNWEEMYMQLNTIIQYHPFIDIIGINKSRRIKKVKRSKTIRKWWLYYNFSIVNFIVNLCNLFLNNDCV